MLQYHFGLRECSRKQHFLPLRNVIYFNTEPWTCERQATRDSRTRHDFKTMDNTSEFPSDYFSNLSFYKNTLISQNFVFQVHHCGKILMKEHIFTDVFATNTFHFFHSSMLQTFIINSWTRLLQMIFLPTSVKQKHRRNTSENKVDMPICAFQIQQEHVVHLTIKYFMNTFE